MGQVQTSPAPNKIRKVTSKQENKAEPTVEKVASTSTAPDSADAADRQLNIDEAISYAMTTDNPAATVRRLAAQHKLTDVTSTYKKLEELGHK